METTRKMEFPPLFGSGQEGTEFVVQAQPFTKK